ncbi:hypothetical protein XELAEV_18026663mg [Xenopus laevis]|uniref:Regulator of microtubule dynamics protein 2 n=1 Tax=Xenopus laevis TaxID=8355 RepID=A0A974CUT5_XENLA|nr:hypothetical protein XELAEV_18026663mg [Xenopus laevis]
MLLKDQSKRYPHVLKIKVAPVASHWEASKYERRYITAHTDTEPESGEELGHLNAEKFIEVKADSGHSGSESEKQDTFLMMLDHKEKMVLFSSYYGNKVEFLWRLTRAYGDMFDMTSDIEEKKNYAANGKSIAGKAVQLEESSAEGHTWFAIMCGYLSEYESVQDKIKNGYLFIEHLDKAIELDPQDPLQYYLLGRWCSAVEEMHPGYSKHKGKVLQRSREEIRSFKVL